MSFVKLETDYNRILPLITEEERFFLPPVLGIVDRTQPGEVYINDINAPQCAAIVNQNSGNIRVRLLGNWNKASFNSGLVEYL